MQPKEKCKVRRLSLSKQQPQVLQKLFLQDEESQIQKQGRSCGSNEKSKCFCPTPRSFTGIRGRNKGVFTNKAITICDLLEATRTYSDLILLMSFCLILLFFSRSLLEN